MKEKPSSEELCRKILEDNGGIIADKARTILLEDPTLKSLRTPLEFVSRNWRNPLTPALIRLSCEAVGGQPERTDEPALAINLISLSLYVWDDVIDKTATKSFRPTLFGKFGEGTALIVGGLASAKAFTILNQMNAEKEKQAITHMMWNFLAKMAIAETPSLKSANQETLCSSKKMWKIKTEATDLETCMNIGAIMGDGSKTEIQHLGRYGLCLGIILEVCKDFHVSVNLTAGLAERIRRGVLPYSLLWASERSEKVRKNLNYLLNQPAIKQSQIKEIVEDALETKMLESTTATVRKYAEKAKNELLTLNSSKATQTLRMFIEAQPSIFRESLSRLQALES
jgi:geranylgeranyl diphosphate synthase, type II